MNRTNFTFPDWLGELVPEDELFGIAYEDVGEKNRAWMKTCIARLFDWYGPRKDVSGEEIRRWQSGLDTRTAHAPADFCVVLFDDNLLSPARLLAALVPALAGGVKQVLAARVFTGTPWRKAVLTGLELAGQEFVVGLDDTQSRRLLTELREGEHAGSVTVLGPKAAAIVAGEMRTASRMSFWRPRFSRFATIWMEDENSFDLETLAFIHPDMVFQVFGAEVDLPANNFSYEGEGFDACMDALTDVAYLPADRMDAALNKARLLLGPGQEGCWFWPDLHPDHFQSHCTAWTLGG
jgi:hypothetical protein